MNLCTMEGCSKPARSSRAQWCAMHYHRWYRHGSPELSMQEQPPKPRPSYANTHKPNHPLSNKYGNAYVHRVTLYDAIGPGTHACHWCSTPVTWETRGPKQLQVDHVNENKKDNRLENLVPACRSCNVGRSKARLLEEQKAQGWWSNHDTIARLSTPGRMADAIAQMTQRIAELQTALSEVAPDHPLLAKAQSVHS